VALELRLGLRTRLCRSYLWLARAHTGGDDAAARELAEAIDVITLGEGLETREELRDLWRLGLALAKREHAAGRVEAARASAVRALRHAEQCAQTYGAARLHGFLARIAATAADAGEHRTAARTARERLGDRLGAARLLVASGRATGDRELRRRGRALAAEVGRRPRRRRPK
jgi:hypothetical protein